VSYLQKNPFDSKIPNEFDLIITAGFQITSFHSNNTSHHKQIHLCQGYEGNFKEAVPFLAEIEAVYKKDIPKIVISENLLVFLKQKFNLTKVFNIGQGLEHQFFFPNQTNQNEKYDDLINIFLFGPLKSNVKQIKKGIEAFKKASIIYSGLRLIRVSIFDDEQYENLEGFDYEYHINLRPAEVGELLRAKSGLLLAPSAEGEGFGLPPLEAMACGLPVVMTSISSFTSFDQSKDYAEFVIPGDPEDMFRGIMEVINNHAKRKYIKQRGIEVASNYSYELVAEELEKTLKILHRHNKITY